MECRQYISPALQYTPALHLAQALCSLCCSRRCLILLCRWELRSAIGTASGTKWDGTQTIGTITSRWSFCSLRFVQSHQRIYRFHDKEIDDQCKDQEGDDRIDECPKMNRTAPGNFKRPS